MARLVVGKLPHAALRRLLAKAPGGPGVIVGPALGEDACALDTRGQVLVASTDPITFTSENLGYYAVHVNANDVATMGARPRWFLASLMLPDGFDSRKVAGIFEGLAAACRSIGVSLAGGHTEVTSGVTRPVMVGTMLGTVSRRKLVRPERAREGDVVLLTKRLAVEGTAIIARERRRRAERILGMRRAARARSMLFRPGISVVPEAMAAVETAPVHAMHDPTEGGLISAVRELSFVTGLGVEIHEDRIPVYEQTKEICKDFGLDPLGLIASGSLLIVASPRSAKRISMAIRRKHIECAEIGRIAGTRLRLLKGGKARPLPPAGVDEITRVL
ncbi:MAG: AIR synthase family protein [bacterium]|jgi:hydrogenase maturation factor